MEEEQQASPVELSIEKCEEEGKQLTEELCSPSSSTAGAPDKSTSTGSAEARILSEGLVPRNSSPCIGEDTAGAKWVMNALENGRLSTFLRDYITEQDSRTVRALFSVAKSALAHLENGGAMSRRSLVSGVAAALVEGQGDPDPCETEQQNEEQVDGSEDRIEVNERGVDKILRHLDEAEPQSGPIMAHTLKDIMRILASDGAVSADDIQQIAKRHRASVDPDGVSE